MPPLTLLDIAKMNNSDPLVGLIEEAAGAHPELRIGSARTIKGTHYKRLVRTALPNDGFRAANEGKVATKSTYVNRLVECFIVDASFDIDKAVAEAHEDGADAAVSLEASGHMAGALASVCKQFYYGTASGATGAPVGFQGLLDFVDSTMVVDALGDGGATCSSVWAVKFGAKDVSFVFGRNGEFSEGELLAQQVVDAANQKYWALCQEIQGWLGLQVGSKNSIGRIKNLDTESDEVLTDVLLAQLLAKFPVGARPDVFLMSRRSLAQLQNSRTATNATGAPAPIPSEAFLVRIEATDSILDTEAAA